MTREEMIKQAAIRNRSGVAMTKIICPNCESVESASIEYFHECSNCGYIITDSDWQKANYHPE